MYSIIGSQHLYYFIILVCITKLYGACINHEPFWFKVVIKKQSNLTTFVQQRFFFLPERKRGKEKRRKTVQRLTDLIPTLSSYNFIILFISLFQLSVLN